MYNEILYNRTETERDQLRRRQNVFSLRDEELKFNTKVEQLRILFDKNSNSGIQSIKY